jgi:hypothetical protein
MMTRYKFYRGVLTVQVSFSGAAATAIRMLFSRGLHGESIRRVVEGLALAELRREVARSEGIPRCVRCGNDGNPCSMCGARGQKQIPCDPVTGDELETSRKRRRRRRSA